MIVASQKWVDIDAMIDSFLSLQMYMRGLYTISAERNQERKVNKMERKCIFATVFPAGHNGLKHLWMKGPEKR